jgi:G3E family GTPase
MPRIPVTVFTGYLGSGKTTIIRNLVQQLPKDYNISLLKNEFGDVAIDSLLLKESNIKVTEMLNGCLCCVLVGRMDAALHELIAKYNPQRIIIETSGSAYPAPIAWEIDKLKDILYLDGIITVIDVLNFAAYKDVSYTAKIQAQYTDLILLNKVELVSAEKLDKVIDSVNDLNSETNKIVVQNAMVDPNLIFGIDRSLSQTVLPNSTNPKHQSMDADMLIINTDKPLSKTLLENLVLSLPKWDFIRIKGLIVSNEGKYLINYIFGKYSLEKIETTETQSKLLLLGKNFAFHTKNIASKLALTPNEYHLTLRHLD